MAISKADSCQRDRKVSGGEGNNQMEEKKDLIKAIQIFNEETVDEEKDKKLDKQDSSSSKCKLSFEEEDNSKEKKEHIFMENEQVLMTGENNEPYMEHIQISSIIYVIIQVNYRSYSTLNSHCVSSINDFS